MALQITREQAETERRRRQLERAGYPEWLRSLFPKHIQHDFAEHHHQFWQWIWSLTPGDRPHPFVAVWPRGGAKSASGEMGAVALGARNVRKYGLYISMTQDQADDHVGNVGSMMEEQNAYPQMGEKLVTKHGLARGWRRNRLRAANGFTIDALGLDSAVRGAKLDERRPDFMWFDDIDDEADSKEQTDKKIRTITRAIIPAGSQGNALLFIQNLVKNDGVIDRLIKGETDFASDAIISGPIPALKDMVSVDQQILEGIPSWEGQSLERCQEMVEDMGMTAFMAECQHDVSDPAGGMYDHVEFRHEEFTDELLSSMDRVVCWVDPAVSDTDRSDANGIQIDGIRGQVKFRFFSWEQRSSPLETLRMAIRMGVKFGCEHVGVETDQGGDTWRSVYDQAARSLGIVAPPPFTSRKAGAGFGSKQHRQQQMLADYERGRIVHVLGTHDKLERALKRFPRTKPFDLADAAWHSWEDLRHGSGQILHIAHPTRGGKRITTGELMYPFRDDLGPRERKYVRAIEETEISVRKTRKILEDTYGG